MEAVWNPFRWQNSRDWMVNAARMGATVVGGGAALKSHGEAAPRWAARKG